MTPVDFLLAKMALSANFRFRETSGFRCWEWNTKVGGAKTSQHQYWLASDIVVWHTTDVEALIKQARRLGLKAIDEGDHVHLQAP